MKLSQILANILLAFIGCIIALLTMDFVKKKARDEAIKKISGQKPENWFDVSGFPGYFYRMEGDYVVLKFGDRIKETSLNIGQFFHDLSLEKLKNLL